MPPLPPHELRGAGRLVKLVSSTEGTLARDVEAPEGLESLVRWEPEPGAQGEIAQVTVDNNSCAGYAWLLHGDAAVVESDYEQLRRLQPELFVVEELAETAAQ